MAKRGKRKDDEATTGKLTLKQRAFIDAYLGEANGNATEAARIAGYACPSEQGYENLRKPQIASAIEEHLDRSAMSAKEVLSRLSAIANGNLGDYFDVSEVGTPILNLTRAKTAGKLNLIHQLKPSRDGWGVKLYDRVAALRLLGQFHGLFTEKVDLTSGGKPIAITTVEVVKPDGVDDESANP